MVKVSTLAIAGGTLVLAAGAGFYMQTSPTTPDDTNIAVLTTVPELAPATITPEMDKVELDAITLTSSDIAPQIIATVDAAGSGPATLMTDFEPAKPFAPLLASLQDPATGPREEMLPQPEAEVAVQGCQIDMTGEARAAAMVALHLSAPCNPGARVDFSHEGMVFSALTDAKGQIDVIVPALSETASFLAMLDVGNGAAVEVSVNTLGFYDRSVVMWTGDAGVELHALEFGAVWDSEGHVWSGAPRDATVAALGEGGFITRLGDVGLDNGQMAEIYTFPTGTARVGGDIALSVEVEVTEVNCGRDLSARILRVEEARAAKPGDLTLAMPGCDAVGDFIQLKNPVPDLKIAVR